MEKTLRRVRICLQILATALSAYGFISHDFRLQSLMMLLLGLLMIIVGIMEFQKEQKWYSFLSMIVAIFLLFVSVKGFLFSW